MMKFLRPSSKCARWVYLIIASGGYILIALLLHHLLGPPAAALGVIPVMVSGWLWGPWWALVAVVFATLLHTGLSNLTGYPGWDTLFVSGGGPGILVVALMGMIFGHLSRVSRRYRQERNEYKQMQRKQRAHADFLILLNDIIHAALEADDTSSLLKILANRMGELFAADDCFITLWDEARGMPIPAAAYGQLNQAYASTTAKPGEHNLTAAVLEAGHALAVDDIRDTPYLSPSVVAEFPFLRSALALPLIAAEKKLGAVLLAFRDFHRFTEDEIGRGELAAWQISLAMVKVSLMEEARTRLQELAVLHEVALATIEATNEDDLIEHVTRIIGTGLFPDNFGVLLLDELAGELYLHSSYRLGEREQPIRIPLGKGITGQVARSGLPRRVDDISQDPDYINVDSRVQSELCVPLKVGDHIVGVVNAESARLKAFTQADENLLTIVAGQLATVIERLRTTEAEYRKTKQLERANALIKVLAQVGARASAAPNPDGVMQTLGTEMAKLGLTCLVAFSDPESGNINIRYTSFPSRIVRLIERASKRKMQDFRISSKRFFPLTQKISEPALLRDPIAIASNILADFPKHAVEKVLRPIGLTESIPVCHLPLVVKGKFLGILWLWGEGLRESDLPTMSIFASQIAIALQNANLLAEIRRLAITDELTGVYNRRHFFELGRLEFDRSRRYNRLLFALFLDLDHFKRVNDRFGHAAGDKALQAVIGLCRKQLRSIDIIGRYGGDEFVILLAETKPASACQAAERLRELISEMQIPTKKGIIRVTASIGIAGIDENTADLVALVDRADQAAYAAKQAGRNRVAIK